MLTAKLGFGERIKQVMRERASDLERDYGNKEFGEEIGLASRGKPYTAQAITEWIAERSEPNVRAWRAMVKVTGRPLTWLMALDATEADPMTDQGAIEDPASDPMDTEADAGLEDEENVTPINRASAGRARPRK